MRIPKRTSDQTLSSSGHFWPVYICLSSLSHWIGHHCDRYPKITNEFNSIEGIGWYGSSYMLAAACLFPISGRIYQLYSTKSVFLINLIIFEAGSALCGAAPSSVAFIIGRAIAGLGSAGIFTGSMMKLSGSRAPTPQLLSTWERQHYTPLFRRASSALL